MTCLVRKRLAKFAPDPSSVTIVHNQHPDTPDRPLFIEVFRSKTELKKILWITAIWTFFSLGQAVYDHTLLLSRGVAVTPAEFASDLLANLLATIVAGLLGGALLVAYVQRWIRNNPYGQAIAFILIAFTTVILCISTIAFLTKAGISENDDLLRRDFLYHIGVEIRSLDFLKDYFLWLCIVLATIAGILINDKYGPGNFSSFLMGKYFRPKREEHIFMFLDLRSSTYIAQILGEEKYFHFIKDVIRDVTPVILHHKGNIYQYVGDEITVSWWMGPGLQKLNCIRCPLEVRRIIENRSRYYIDTYGVVPDFKAGLHCGPVMVGEVGVVKRDIAFSGGVVGTAARIQKRCNHLEVNLLISHDLKELLSWEGSRLKPEHKGDLLIKGQVENLPLYTVISE